LNYDCFPLGKSKNANDLFVGGKLDERFLLPVFAVDGAPEDVTKKLFLHAFDCGNLGYAE
jgi:hypothetical protein